MSVAVEEFENQRSSLDVIEEHSSRFIRCERRRIRWSELAQFGEAFAEFIFLGRALSFADRFAVRDGLLGFFFAFRAQVTELLLNLFDSFAFPESREHHASMLMPSSRFEPLADEVGDGASDLRSASMRLI